MPKVRASRTTVIQDDRNGNPQLIRTVQKRWSAKAEAVFLDTLASTCNVKTSVEAAGFSTTTVYYHRRNKPGFAERWQEALQIGVERLEGLALETAERSLRGEPIDPASPLPRMSVSEAIQVIQLWRRTVKEGVTRRGGRPRHEPDLDELRAGIVRKLEAIERARGRA